MEAPEGKIVLINFDICAWVTSFFLCIFSPWRSNEERLGECNGKWTWYKKSLHNVIYEEEVKLLWYFFSFLDFCVPESPYFLRNLTSEVNPVNCISVAQDSHASKSNKIISSP